MSLTQSSRCKGYVPSDVYSCTPCQDSHVLPLPELPVCWWLGKVHGQWRDKAVDEDRCGLLVAPLATIAVAAALWARTHPAWLGWPYPPVLRCDMGAWPFLPDRDPSAPWHSKTGGSALLFEGWGKVWAQGLHLLGTEPGAPGAARIVPHPPSEGPGKGAPGRDRCRFPGRTRSSPVALHSAGGSRYPCGAMASPRVETGPGSATAPGWRAAGRRTRSEDRRPGGKAEGGREAGGAGRTGGRWQCRRAGRRRPAGQRAAPPHLSPAPRSEVEVSGGAPRLGRSGAQRRGWAVGALRGAGGWGPVPVALVPGAAGHPAPGSVALLRRCWWRRGAGRQRRCLGCAPGPALHTCRRGRRGWVRRGRRAPGRCGGKMLLGGVCSLSFHLSVPNAGNTAGLPGVWSSSVFERLHCLFVLCEVVACAFLCVGSFY